MSDPIIGVDPTPQIDNSQVYRDFASRNNIPVGINANGTTPFESIFRSTFNRPLSTTSYNPVVAPITSNNLSGTTAPVSIPTTPTVPGTAAANLSGTTGSIIQDYLNAKETAATAASKASTEDLASVFKDIVDVQTSRNAEEAKAGLPAKATAVTNFTNQLEAEQRSLENAKKAIYENGGSTTEQANASFAEVQRKSLSKQADLAILQSAANRDYTTAASIIDKKIANELEPLQTKLEFAKIFYQDNKEALSKADDRAFQNMIKENDRALSNKQDLLDKTNTVLLEAAKNGASSDVLKSILSAKTVSAAIFAAGNSLNSPTTSVVKLDSGDTLLVNTKTGQTIKDFGGGTGGGSVAAIAVGNKLNGSKGTDGYTNTDLYASERAKSKMSASDFDNRFGYLLNPNARARLGVASASAGSIFTKDQISQQIYKQMNDPAWSTASDDQKRAYIQSLGANPTDYNL